ncbi:PTS sugar transporter subunit IIB [Weissella coleopterorum]|uniref:PTS sugar transporter subunit IIB n=1 Tax=Weissella coleopterorum TaxID=2714949 RepID=A0A6G8B1S0_9LACO|nr:PTS sugar transporter subunit IIB [Weissella coleopterorum]QIL51172.1 PTS sugar transporter subunit IIB [Weissella coleopterorum]
MKFLAVCQSGLGTSFMVEMNIKQVLIDLNVTENIEIEHVDVGSATAGSADYFFIESTLAEAVSNLPRERLVLLKSIIDADEVKAAVVQVLDRENIAHS